VSGRGPYSGAIKGIATAFKGDPLDWLEEHLRIPHSARSPRFAREQAPWLNEPFRAFCDHDVTQINVAAPTGGGKTTFLEMIVPYLIAEQPGPTMLVGQNDDTSKEWAETRLIPVLNACKPVARLFPQDRHDKRKTSILFPHMPLLLCGANISSLQEKSMRYVYGDETWRWRAGMIGEAKKRHHDRWNRKTILVSQGWDDGHEMDDEWALGELREWGARCVQCETWHPYRWENVHYDAQPDADVETIAATAKHVCPSCQHVTPDTTAARRELALRGDYGEPVRGKKSVSGVKSFTWNAIGVWWISWADLVSEWLNAQTQLKKGVTEPLKQFRQKRLAQTWKEDFGLPEVTLVAGDYVKDTYAQGQPIEGEKARFLTVDRQQTHFWGIVRAWTADGTSKLLWEGSLFQIKDIRELQLRYKVQNKLTFLDSGFETATTYEDCGLYDWTALKGSGEEGFNHQQRAGVKTKKAYSLTEYRKTAQGKQVRLISWANEAAKDHLARIRSVGPPQWEIPADVSESYRLMMNSETKREKIDPKTKKLKMRWVPIREANHLWDCEAMQVAVAMMLGIAYEPTIE